MVPTSATCTMLARSGILKTCISRTSSGPILYALFPGVAADVSFSAAVSAPATTSAACVGANDAAPPTLFKEGPQPLRQAAQNTNSVTARTGFAKVAGSLGL